MKKSKACAALRKWRDRQRPRLTQNQFAAQLKVDPSILSRWERGTKKPSAEMQHKIYAATKVPMQWWFEDADESPTAAVPALAAS